jgi:hypothetical protein
MITVLVRPLKSEVHLQCRNLALTGEQISLHYKHTLVFLVTVLFRARVVNLRFRMKKSGGVTTLPTDSFLISAVTGTGI